MAQQLSQAQQQYSIYGKLRAEIEDFDNKGVYIIGRPSVKDQFDKKNRGRFGGYYYSQRLTLEAVDLAMASKFKKGNIDEEGKRKYYMNIVNFHKEVAMNQINVNTSNYIFTPTNDDNVWPVFLMANKFKKWAQDESYDDVIDKLAEDFCGKGSCVVKRTKKKVERIPLRTMRNTQTATSLEIAARTGGYVILESEMYYTDMENYKGWNLDGISHDKAYVVFEKYGMIPKGAILVQNGQPAIEDDWKEWVLSIQIIAPDIKTFEGEAGKEDGHVLFISEIATFPLEEAHYEQMDGRWLGVGEVEKQLENQIQKNYVANIRNKGLLWGVKKIFQSTDEDIAQNLQMEVKDGEVLRISKPGGNVTQVNTQSQQLSDMNAADQAVDANAQKISFSFDTATGDTPPSGTPFRLGAILDAAVSKYFKRKQDTFSNFLKRSWFDQIIPIFKDENDDPHNLTYGVSHDDYQALRDGMTIFYANELVHKEWMNKNYKMTFEAAVPLVTRELARHPQLFVEIPKDFYDDADCYMELNINEPIAGEIESLTTLYQSMVQQQDPRAEKVLEQIFAIKGLNIQAILGPKPTPPPAAPAPSAAMQPQPSPLPGNPQPQPAQ